MATFDQRIGPDGKIVYRVQVRRKGYATQTATFSKLSEAKQWARVAEGTVWEGLYLPTPEAKRHTRIELIDRYRREVLPHKRPSTISMQRQYLRWWQTHLEHYLLADMTPTVLVEYRTIHVQGRANATVVRYLAVLSYTFTMAMRAWSWCDDNPGRKISKPKEPRGRVRFLSEDERQRLLDACKESSNPYL